MNGAFLHSLTLCLSGTSTPILALRGVEGVAQRDVQAVVAAHSVLCHLITATVHVYGLNTTLYHVCSCWPPVASGVADGRYCSGR